MNVGFVFAICLIAALMAFFMMAAVYVVTGFGKGLYHDLLGWHEPIRNSIVVSSTVDVTLHAVCRHCGKEIVQDSQGSWFEA